MNITNDVKSKFEDASSERAVIACILQDPELLVEAQAKLEEADFLTKHNKAIYSVISLLSSQGAVSFDLMTVIDFLEKNSMLASIGESYLSALFEMEVDVRNFHIYIGFVLDCSTKFKLFKQAEFIQNEIIQNLGHAEGKLDSQSLIASAESRVLDISMQMKGVEEAIDFSTNLRERIKHFAENPVEIRGLTSNIPLLDKALNGFSPGSLTIVAGQKKAGKSLVLLNIAAHMSYTLGIPVLYIDTEMSTGEQQTRALSHLSAVPERKILNGSFSSDQKFCERIEKACSRIENGLLLHKYYPGYTVEGLKSLVRKYRARHGIEIFIFDYIKVPESGFNGSLQEHQLLGNVTIALKDLAGQLNIPGIAAAQIRRSETGAPKTRYHESDVADSDKIGRYCSNLLAWGRKSPKEVEEDGMDCGTHRLQILLARAGGTLFNGIDMDCHLPTLTVRQAFNQSNGIPDFDGDGKVSW